MKLSFLHLALTLALLTGFLVLFTLMVSEDDDPVASASGYTLQDENGEVIGRAVAMSVTRTELKGESDSEFAEILPPPTEELPDTRVDLLEGPLLRTYHENGRLFQEGQQARTESGLWERHGSWTQWHDNGEVEELGAYQHGEEHDLWRWWHANGERWCEGEWNAGKRNGAWNTWYDDGRVQMVAHYDESGEGHGQWINFYSNGTKAFEGAYVHGELNGPWTAWNEDGSINIERTGTYKLGVKISD
jgi:hypothetical protein